MFSVLGKPLALDRAVDRILASVGRRDDTRVVIVDDDADVRRVLSDALVAAGCRVRAVRTGSELLEETMHERPDAIVLDPLSSGLDGLSALARMRMDAALATTPVTVLLPLELSTAEMERLSAAVETIVRARRGRVHATAELLRAAAGVPLQESVPARAGSESE